MKKYRPKTQIMYSYGTLYKATIWCYPQSRWTRLRIEGSNKVYLEKHNVIIEISEEDFEKQWVEVKGDKE